MSVALTAAAQYWASAAGLLLRMYAGAGVAPRSAAHAEMRSTPTVSRQSLRS